MVTTEIKYKTEVIRAMQMLAQHPKSIFIGQTVGYPGSIISSTLKDVPMEKRLEFPVAEELQMGLCTGMALNGYLPIAVYPRIDFLLLAINQLSNHLDILDELTNYQYHAKVIIRTIVGTKIPLDAGLQHSRDHTEVFRTLLKNISVIKLNNAKDVMPEYMKALESKWSTLIIEKAELY